MVYQLTLYILLSLTQCWQSTYMAFNGKLITSTEISGWTNPLTGNQPSIDICTANGMQYIWLDSTFTIAEINLDLPPSYSVETIADIYFYRTFDHEYAAMWMDGIQQFSQTKYVYSMFQYANICYPGTNYLELYSVIGTINPHSTNTLNLKFDTDLDQTKGDESVYIRNVQVFIEPCHQTCLTCIGPTSVDCTSCHYQTPLADNSCNLCSDLQASFTHLTQGCLSECPSNYLADKDNFCIFNQNLQTLTTFYQGTTFPNNEMELIEDKRLTYSLNSRSLAILCGSQQVTGPLFYQDMQQKVILISQTTTLLRIRASFYFSQWTDQEQLSLYMNDQNACQVFYSLGTLTSNNCKITKYSLSETCGTEIYDQIRIELVFHLVESVNSISVKFQASIKLSQNSKWGIRDVTIERKECSKNCDACKNQDNCQSCSSGYKLYKGQCTTQCPIHSIDLGGNCEDFDEQTDMTKYAIKEFYDMSTDVHTANNMFILVSQNPPNFGKGAGIYFSYLDNKRIFGGTLVWRNAKFSKTITVTESHYGIRLRMKVILGDAFSSDTFQYTVNGFGGILSRSSAGIDGQIWGAADSDYQIQVDTGLISNSNSGVYQFIVECLASAGLNYANCGIADLFVTILQCPFQCDSCINYNTCLLDKSPTSPGFTSVGGLRGCSDGYYIDYQANTCQTCAVNFCNKCSDKYICTECQSGLLLQINGTCQCSSNQFLDATSVCKDCHSRCAQCSGISESDCLACYSFQNRILYKNKCECLPYYQENSLGDQCEPICGDMYIVGGEECDDGNFNRFDGCHNCKYECQEECLLCYQGRCFHCENGYVLNEIIHRCFKQSQDQNTLNIQNELCGNGVLDSKEECDDGNAYPFDGCHFCMNECVDHCQHCVRGNCLMCVKDYYFDELLELCQPTITQSQVTSCTSLYNATYDYHQLCFNQENNFYDGCPQFCKNCILGQCLQCQDEKGFFLDSVLNQCVYQCSQSDHQFYVSQNSILQTVCNSTACEYGVCYDDSIQNYSFQKECPQFCKNCILGQCLQCQDEKGFFLDSVLNQCIYQCSQSDSQIFVTQNSILQTVCESNDCPINCQHCEYGVCQQCEIGFELINNICSATCGDQIVTAQEQCDDGNDQQFDGCYRCIIECVENCQICSASTCLLCDIGWGLDTITRECEPICGDGLVKGNELCDDGNNTPYDGCYECQFQCQEECDNCYFGVCYECQSGWQLVNSNCIPICGDGIRVGFEECDDGNYEEFDGCYKCKFQCSEHCVNCDKGKCSECEQGYKSQMSKCIDVCGDGQVAIGQEQCDDGNIVDGDGCSGKCLIENGWFCLTQSLLSYCQMFSPPLMYLEIIKDDESQYKSVQIRFSQLLKQVQITSIQFRIKIQSQQHTQDDFYELELEPVQEPSLLEFQDIIYAVNIKFIQNSQNNLLIVQLLNKNVLINSNKQEIENDLSSIRLSFTNFLSNDSIDNIDSIKSVNTVVIYTTFFLFGMGLFFGNLGILWSLLDLLQFFSYLKYVNNPFPENLTVFFEIFDQISMKPFLKLLGFDWFIYLLFGNEEFLYLKPAKRFADDQINALLFDNISSIIFIFFITYLTYLIQSFTYFQLGKKLNFKNKAVWYANIILWFKKFLFACINTFYYSQLIRLLFTSSYEIFFALYLQFSVGNQINYSEFIQTFGFVSALISLFAVVSINIKFIYINPLPYKRFMTFTKSQISTIFEGINLKSAFGSQLNCFFLIRRNIFMIFLVFCQSVPLLQPLLIAVNSTFFFFYLVNKRPFENKFEDFNVKVTEFTVQLCCFIFFSFEINMNHYQIYSYETYYDLGLVCIVLISGNLFLQFILDLYQQLKYLRDQFHKAKTQPLFNPYFHQNLIPVQNSNKIDLYDFQQSN